MKVVKAPGVVRSSPPFNALREGKKTNRERKRAYERRHPERVVSARKDYYHRRGWHLFAMGRKQRKVRAFAILGGPCAFCGESDIDRLTIDHVNGDGSHGRKHNSESGDYLYGRIIKGMMDNSRFRVLCYSCNQSFAKFGHTPHSAAASLYCRDWL